MHIDHIEHRQSMLAAIIDSSEDAIISKDLNSRITSWNKAAERMFGYTEEEVIGQSIQILIPSDRKSEEEMILSSLRKGERVEHFETIRMTKNGRLLDISLTISPIRNSAGTVIGASKIARDITRQKKTEQRLELINSLGRSIGSQLDVQSILQKVTDVTTELSGAQFGAFFYNKTDSRGETYMLFTLSGAPREAFEKFGMPRNTAIFKQTFEGTGILRSDNITKDPRYGKNAPHKGMPEGHLPVVSYLAVPVMSKGNVVIGGLFFGHSSEGMFLEEHENLVAAIASQASIALDNAMLYEEIHALNSKKDEFIGFASHELKTPLTTIKGYLQLAEITETSAKEFFPKINKQVARLEAIIADLLDISKIQAGRLDLHFVKTTLNSLIQEAIESLDFSRHKIEADIPSEDVSITIDNQKMSQVLVNLLTNALKYSKPHSRILVTAIRLGDQARISVSDEGVGIAAAHLEKIFNQFYRIYSTSNSAKGMGLGLYISKEIMEAHLGKIWAESIEKKGSTFHIQFPIDRAKGLS